MSKIKVQETTSTVAEEKTSVAPDETVDTASEKPTTPLSITEQIKVEYAKRAEKARIEAEAAIKAKVQAEDARQAKAKADAEKARKDAERRKIEAAKKAEEDKIAAAERLRALRTERQKVLEDAWSLITPARFALKKLVDSYAIASRASTIASFHEKCIQAADVALRDAIEDIERNILNIGTWVPYIPKPAQR